MTNAITTPTIESLVATIQVSDKFRVDDYGMHVSGTPSVEEFMEVAYMLGKVRGALAWAVGDYMNAFESHYGETMAQAEVMFPEKSYQYLMDCKWVSKKVTHDRRHRGSWSAWKEVLVLDQKQQNKLLKLYEEGTLSSQKELRMAVREQQEIEPSETRGLGSIIKRLENFFDIQKTLTSKQAGLLEKAIGLLKEVHHD